MNPTIVKIIDLMFRGIPETEETSAIREELLTNSQARYEDLLAAGESPNTALGQVLDSLRGMEDVLDEYRQNTARQSVPTLYPNENQTPFAGFERIAEEMENQFGRMTDKAERTAASAMDSAARQSSSAFDRLERMADEMEDKFERFADKAENTAKSALSTAMEGLRSAMDSVSGLFSQPEGSFDNPTDSQTGNGAATDGSWKATGTWESTGAGQPSYGMSQPASLYWQPTDDPETLSITLSPAQVNRLNIQLTGEDIEVEASEDGLIHLEISKSDENLYLLENVGGCLNIRRNPNGSVVNGQQDVQSEELDGLGGILSGIGRALKNVLTIARTCGDTMCLQLPDGLEQITLLTTSGDIDLETLHGKAASISTTSGDIEVTGCTFAGPVGLNTTSGDMNVEDSRFQAPVTLNSTSGDLEVRADAPQLSANTTSGDVDVEGQLSLLKANSVSGDLDFCLTGALSSLNANTTSGDITVCLPETLIPAVRLNTTSGDAQVLCATNPNAAVTIQLNSVSGDLSVENF